MTRPAMDDGYAQAAAEDRAEALAVYYEQAQAEVDAETRYLATQADRDAELDARQMDAQHQEALAKTRPARPRPESPRPVSEPMNTQPAASAMPLAAPGPQRTGGAVPGGNHPATSAVPASGRLPPRRMPGLRPGTRHPCLDVPRHPRPGRRARRHHPRVGTGPQTTRGNRGGRAGGGAVTAVHGRRGCGRAHRTGGRNVTSASADKALYELNFTDAEWEAWREGATVAAILAARPPSSLAARVAEFFKGDPEAGL